MRWPSSIMRRRSGAACPSNGARIAMKRVASHLLAKRDEYARCATLEMVSRSRRAAPRSKDAHGCANTTADHAETLPRPDEVATGSTTEPCRVRAARNDPRDDAVELSVLAVHAGDACVVAPGGRDFVEPVAPVRSTCADGRQRGAVEARIERFGLCAGDRRFVPRRGFSRDYAAHAVASVETVWVR